ncbi:MAG: nucleotidyltransferase domain-containing protein [Planctomycetota bacterium]
MAILDAEVEKKALTATMTLSQRGVVRAAYVFGSHAEGRGDRWSDIDVAAFMEGVEGLDIRGRARLMAQVMEEAGPEVEVHLLPPSSLELPEPGGFVEYILRHGVRVVPRDG